MRISIALAVIAAVVAEFVAAERGLGYLVFTASSNLDMRLVFSAVVLLAVMGILLFQCVRLLQSIAVPWLRESPEHGF
jgi:NitT/TauT family transport system permease protein